MALVADRDVLRAGVRNLRWNGIVVGLAVAVIVAGALSARLLLTELPASQWWQAAFAPGPQDLVELYVHYALLPRMAVSLLAGAALALSGVIFQQVLRNPLAEASTLGVAPGAMLAIVIATLWYPDLVLNQQEGIAFAGAMGALGLTFLLAWREAASPLRLILAGLIVSLVCGLLTSVATVLYGQGLRN
ncbi:MAG: iron chelate uptake ABC transporter family permease subunit, partial [Pseudomonadota bacterium]